MGDGEIELFGKCEIGICCDTGVGLGSDVFELFVGGGVEVF